jgi:hypothetical protein
MTSEIYESIFEHLVGFLGGGISPSQRRYLHRTAHNTEKRGNTSMPRAGFEPTIPAFERLTTVRALNCAAIGTDASILIYFIYHFSERRHFSRIKRFLH